ncbi:MAG: site-specific DNA-methyltransferase [Ignavibacteria bacterium]|nr:site-specific DNA-methyltransferase [Ignavibacteria bacterium]
MFIEGENLEVLRVLQKSLFGKVKMIYIDPPYNTGNDSFVYPDDFAERQDEYKRRTGITDENGYLNKQDLWKKNTKENGQFHSVWLSMMFPRLYLSRNLLSEDGVIFISIDDNEASNLKLLCDEVFGQENFVAVFPWKKRTAKSDVPYSVSQDFEWIYCYTKSLFNAGLESDRKYFQSDDYPNDRWRLSDMTKQTSADERPNSAFNMIDPKTQKSYSYNPKRVWAVTKDTFQDYYDKGKIVFPDDYQFLNISIPSYRVFESEDKQKALKKYGIEDAMKTASTQLPKSVGMSENGNKDIVELFGGKIFSFPKPTTLVKHFLNIINDKEALILDFFSGSGTTAQAVLELNEEDGGNRRFICVQMPEPTDENSEAFKAGYTTISAITKARITKVIGKITKARAEKAEKQAGELYTEDTTAQQPLSFAAYSLTESNFKIWRSDVQGKEAIANQLNAFQQSEIEGAEHERMFTELCLKSGLGLNIGYTEENGFFKTQKALWFCFEPYQSTMKEEIVQSKPDRVVFLNSCFQSDMELTNVQLELKEHGIDLVII